MKFMDKLIQTRLNALNSIDPTLGKILYTHRFKIQTHTPILDQNIYSCYFSCYFCVCKACGQKVGLRRQLPYDNEYLKLFYKHNEPNKCLIMSCTDTQIKSIIT